jgi:hypothetical protein
LHDAVLGEERSQRRLITGTPVLLEIPEHAIEGVR